MIFINRVSELDRLQRFAESIHRGTPPRHIAFIGVRRIGKSHLLDRFRATNSGFVVAALEMDEACTTLQTFLLTMARSLVSALLTAKGSPKLQKTASATAIVAAATPFGQALVDELTQRLALLDAKKVSGQDLFVAAASLPQEVARLADVPVLVLADEFQHILDLSVYAPFGGRKRSEDARHAALLQVFRSQVERVAHVGWIVTGSGVRLLKQVLDKGPLMGRFDQYLLAPFDNEETVKLASAIWHELGVQATENAESRVFQLTLGHPFYADVVAREAGNVAARLGQAVSATFVDFAFIDALRRATGQIHIACAEMYDSLATRTPALRGVVIALAAEQPATLTEIDARAQIGTPPLTSRFVKDLEGLGLVSEGAQTRTYVLTDPVFRYWVAELANPLDAPAPLADPHAAREIARRFEEAYLQQRTLSGQISPAYVRETCRTFNGQQVEGRRLGVPGAHIKLPQVTDVKAISAYDATCEVRTYQSEIELDVCFGTDTIWLGELKDRNQKAEPKDIRLAASKAAFLRKEHSLPVGPTWFVSVSGFTEEARDEAKRRNVYLSDVADIEAIRNVTAVARPATPKKATRS